MVSYHRKTTEIKKKVTGQLQEIKDHIGKSAKAVELYETNKKKAQDLKAALIPKQRGAARANIVFKDKKVLDDLTAALGHVTAFEAKRGRLDYKAIGEFTNTIGNVTGKLIEAIAFAKA